MTLTSVEPTKSNRGGKRRSNRGSNRGGKRNDTHVGTKRHITARKNLGANLYGFNDLLPTVNCHKCGTKSWLKEVEPLAWGCSVCGNRVYYTYGALRQQIDIVMSTNRRHEFVRSLDGKCIASKLNDTVKMLRLRKSIS